MNVGAFAGSGGTDAFDQRDLVRDAKLGVVREMNFGKDTAGTRTLVIGNDLSRHNDNNNDDDARGRRAYVCQP